MPVDGSYQMSAGGAIATQDEMTGPLPDYPYFPLVALGPLFYKALAISLREPGAATLTMFVLSASPL